MTVEEVQAAIREVASRLPVLVPGVPPDPVSQELVRSMLAAAREWRRVAERSQYGRDPNFPTINLARFQEELDGACRNLAGIKDFERSGASAGHARVKLINAADALNPQEERWDRLVGD